jgi:AAA domain
MTDDDPIAAGKAAAERHAREREAERERKRAAAHNGPVDARYGTTIVDSEPIDVDDHHPGEWDGDKPTGDVDADEPPLYAAHILTRSALATLPDPEPLIDNVLDQGTTALLYGRWGTAKSFIALDWAASVATGRKWQGRHTAQRRALYVAGEGAFGFKGRIDAWEVGWHTKISDDGLHILPHPVNLMRPLEVGNLAALIDWGGYSFIVLDTLARCMVGADENSAKDTGMVVDAMVGLLDHTPEKRGVMLGVHHAGKDGKTLRGSSAFEGAADTVYFTSRDGGVITLDREKRKDGPEADRHELKIDLMPGTGSAVISSHRGGEKPERADKLFSTFVTNFSHIGASRTDLRKVSDMADATFYRALSDLVESGELLNTGTTKRPFYMVAGK